MIRLYRKQWHALHGCSCNLLSPCALQVWLMWPFVVWGALIAMCYGVGYSLLGLVDEPTALFNVVNYMAVGFKYDLYLVQVGDFRENRVEVDRVLLC
jgi:hypothetical protein